MLGRARLGPALGRQGCGASAPAADTLIHKNVATDEHGSASVSPFLIRAIRAESCPALMFHGKIQHLFWHQHEKGDYRRHRRRVHGCVRKQSRVHSQRQRIRAIGSAWFDHSCRRGIDTWGEGTIQWFDAIITAIWNPLSTREQLHRDSHIPGAFFTSAHSIDMAGDVVYSWSDLYGVRQGGKWAASILF